ncbi:dienelactone hydrolase domain-containing protein [Gluconacetobacter sp. SXCC-1]|nr:dienelactone hydrolase domain-containing protein [Gluconacetobacter sp. SXCC-1]
MPEGRYLEAPPLRVEDFRHAAGGLISFGFIDESRMGVSGICGGGIGG